MSGVLATDEGQGSADIGGSCSTCGDVRLTVRVDRRRAGPGRELCTWASACVTCAEAGRDPDVRRWTSTRRTLGAA